MRDKQGKAKLSAYAEAFLEYLGRPKTVFDLKDRSRALLLLGAIIILLQQVVELLSD